MSDQMVVYIISGVEDGWPVGPVKVGVTGALAGRLASIQTGSAVPLICVQAFPVPEREIALGLEKAFHKVMGRYRLSGEWFDLDPLDAVRAMTDNIEQMLRHHVGFEGDELDDALVVSGVTVSRARLAKAITARDAAILRTMQ